MKSLQDRVAIITGGAQGIGGASARRLAGEGAKVLVADINMELAEENVGRIREAGGVAEAIETDLSQREDIEVMVARAVELWGRLDILMNNGWGRRKGDSDGSAVDLTESSWDFGMDVMVKAIFRAVKYAVPEMEKTGGGSIVNVASVHGLLMAAGKLTYETAKTAVIGMTKQMAIDFGPNGIRVNAICPGHIVNEKLEKMWAENPERHAFFVDQYPVRRTGVPDDIANAVRFLCSDEASFITGHALVVDGGLTVQLQEDFGVRLAKYVRNHPELEA